MGIPFVYAQENSEIICDVPDPTGHCYNPVPQGNNTYHMGSSTEASVTGINFGIPIVVIVGGVVAIVVVLTLRKRKH